MSNNGESMEETIARLAREDEQRQREAANREERQRIAEAHRRQQEEGK